ncbi:MAG TPA: response regulator [Methanoregula sp.]|nr:response regulator [Methanoregula sp.]
MLSVLLVDDEPALLEVLKPFIERSGEMRVHTAQSAAEALKILQENSFDAIILDYSLPDISGIELLKMLRVKGDTTPVIMFTGVGHERTAIDAINYGANFFLKKEEDPQKLFHELSDMVKNAVESKYVGKKLGTSRKILSDMINFSFEPYFAIDVEGKVVAWNAAMEQLTDTTANNIMGKSDYLYSIPFFGTRRKMLINLVFEPDEEIKRLKYMIISRVAKGPVTALTNGVKKDGSGWTLWSKAMPVYDLQGNFIAAVGIVRDVTGTFEDKMIEDQSQAAEGRIPETASRQPSKPVGLFDKILGKSSGKATSYYKEGVNFYVKEKKYTEALVAFDKALEQDDKLPQVWNDRGLCYRDMGDTINALKSLSRAVELEPDNPELLFNLGMTLEMIGTQNMSNKYLDSAIQTFKMVTNKMPNNADAWNHIGICYNQMGQPEESKFYFDRARDIHTWRKHTPIIPKRDI